MDFLKPEISQFVEPAVLAGKELVGLEKYFADESRYSGSASCLVLPRTTEEVCGAVQHAIAEQFEITVSGARTGISAGAVPNGGMLLSLERMNLICGVRKTGDGSILLHCQAGVTLSEIQQSLREMKFAGSNDWDEESRQILEVLKENRHSYPPDPTEASATLGGTIACNASGAHTFRYGPTRAYVQWLKIVLPDGRILEIERGRQYADANGFFYFTKADGERTRGRIPDYKWPSTKNAAGYYSVPRTDLIDLFIGSEGTLGIITEARVRIIPVAEIACAVTAFCSSESEAVRLTEDLREQKLYLDLDAIEYFGPRALNLLRERRAQLGAASGVPACLPNDAVCALYLDISTAKDKLQDRLNLLTRLLEDNGGCIDKAWAATEFDERERLRIFRHALPESVNALIAARRRHYPTLTKLGTDMAVPPEYLGEIMQHYRQKLEKANLEYLVFGHIGDSHLHINILPRNLQEYEKGWQLYHGFAEKVVELGGSTAAEHGIGKLKRDFLEIMYGVEGVVQMRNLKRIFDPDNRLGKGILFE